MRMWVRSRMPMMWPSTNTESPACSVRISSSVVGNVTRRSATSCLPVEVDVAHGGDVRRRPPRRPALVVDGDRVQGHVRVRVLDMRAQDRHVTAEAHRPDAGLVEKDGELILELRDLRVVVAGPDRPRDRLL